MAQKKKSTEEKMMNKSQQTKGVVEVVLILGAFFALAILGFAGYFLHNIVTQERSTYSIVAVDPLTGDVGIAIASCVPISAGGRIILVPGKGVATAQAASLMSQHQVKMFDLLRQGATASEIIEFVSDDSYDPEVATRQYGVVTLNEELIQVAGFTGKENTYWAGDQQDSTMAVSVQGNTLEDALVVSDALDAFTEEEIGSVELSDRLLRALEAASAAGGDNRCNQGDFQQTAQAAFIAVAKADQLPFIGTLVKDPAPDNPALPWLFISVIEAKGGPNPILELRSQYDTWRSETLPRCEDCNLNPIPVPTGGNPKPLPKTILRIVSRVGLVGVGVGFLIGVTLLLSLPVIIYFRRRKQRSSE